MLKALALLLPLLECASADDMFNPMKVDFTVVSPKNWSQNLQNYRSEKSSQGVLFYSPGDDAKAYINDVFNPLSTKLINIVRMMAIDCTAHEKHCKQEDSNETWKKGPTVISYPPLPRPIKVMEPNAEDKDVLKQLVSVIPRDSVTILKAVNFDSYLDDPATSTVPKAFYFSEKKVPPPSFHSIANAMDDRVDFAFINVNEEGNDKIQHRIIGKKTTLPALAMYKSKKTDIFTGNINSAIETFDWINVLAETFVKGGGFTDAGPVVQHPWMTQVIPEMNKDSHGPVCFKVPGLCAVYATPNGKLSEEELAMLESLVTESMPSNAKDAKFKFSWLNTVTEKKAAASLGVVDITEPHFFIINTNKRLRYTTPVVASRAAVMKEVENLNAGNQRFTAIKGKKTPVFATTYAISEHDEL